MGETMFFERRELSVSNTRFVVEGHTYPLDSVSSARLEVEEPSRTTAILVGVLGLCCYLLERPTAIIIGFVTMAVAVTWATSVKKEFAVVLSTPSGESQAFKSTDREYIELIVGAINQSIVYQG